MSAQSESGVEETRGDGPPPAKIAKVDKSIAKSPTTDGSQKKPKPNFDDHSKPRKYSSEKPKQFENRKEKWKAVDSKFPYGNYDRYYGKRAVAGDSKTQKNVDGSPKFEDNRLAFFKKDWFENKKVLDVGCNVGFMTMEIASRFAPASIVGLDIDGSLIRSAQNILKKKIGDSRIGDAKDGKNQNGGDPKKGGLEKPDASGTQSSGLQTEENGDSGDSKEIKSISSDSHDEPGGSKAENSGIKASPLKHVRFECGNYVLSDDSMLEFVRPEYDAILALNLTKWVHLNWGDEGMKRFFIRVYRHLNPGGIFLMEPQPWSSYKKRRGLTPEIAKCYEQIKFKPDRFRPFLISDEIGFESCEVINQIDREAKGFSRPIYIFRKPMKDKDKTTEETIGEKEEKSGEGDCSKKISD